MFGLNSFPAYRRLKYRPYEISNKLSYLIPELEVLSNSHLDFPQAALHICTYHNFEKYFYNTVSWILSWNRMNSMEIRSQNQILVLQWRSFLMSTKRNEFLFSKMTLILIMNRNLHISNLIWWQRHLWKFIKNKFYFRCIQTLPMK